MYLDDILVQYCGSHQYSRTTLYSSDLRAHRAASYFDNEAVKSALIISCGEALLCGAVTM